MGASLPVRLQGNSKVREERAHLRRARMAAPPAAAGAPLPPLPMGARALGTNGGNTAAAAPPPAAAWAEPTGALLDSPGTAAAAPLHSLAPAGCTAVTNASTGAASATLPLPLLLTLVVVPTVGDPLSLAG